MNTRRAQNSAESRASTAAPEVVILLPSQDSCLLPYVFAPHNFYSGHMERPGHEACWTCRSRHVQCDRSKVPCGKCQKAGLECLKKLPFRWVQGVAVRGNMQGYTYENKSGGTLKKPKHFRFKPAVVKATGRRRNGKIITKTSSPLLKHLPLFFFQTIDCDYFELTPIDNIQMASRVMLICLSRYKIHRFQTLTDPPDITWIIASSH